MNSTEARAAIQAAQTELAQLASQATELQSAWQAAAQAGDDSRCDEIEAQQQQLKRKQTRQEFLRNEAENKLAEALAAEEVARIEAIRTDGAAALRKAAKHQEKVTALLEKLGDELVAYQAAIAQAAQAARVLSGNGFVTAPDGFHCAALAMQHEGGNRRRLAEGLSIDDRSFEHFTRDEHHSIANALEAAR